DYAVMAIEKHGFIKGLYLSVGRITHCRQSVGPLKEWEKP
ncbi:MAG: membrane protein insertion efficiency factor YidD, partial [Candidatus Pacebacteria bacterium]|nr:membrane protein insertion efficiency factor YidD [Candidatus Paceibacterota bacterium]